MKHLVIWPCACCDDSVVLWRPQGFSLLFQSILMEPGLDIHRALCAWQRDFQGICFTCVIVLFISKLFLGKAPWWFLLSTSLRNSIIIPLELPTFYPGRFRWDNRDTAAASTQCHGYKSATCGSKRNSNSPSVTETTKKVHGSKEEWCRYIVTEENCKAAWSEATKPATCW